MSESQVIVQNGRVSVLFKTLSAIAVILISTLLAWMASTLNELDKNVAVLISQNQSKENEHARIDSRITDLEREHRYSIDSGDK